MLAITDRPADEKIMISVSCLGDAESEASKPDCFMGLGDMRKIKRLGIELRE